MLLVAVVDTNNVLFRLREPLRQIIDPDFLLPDKLMNRKILTDEDRQKVRSKDTYQERNDVLLSFVIQKKDASLAVPQFTGCLRDTDQDHVCNFIECDGGKQTSQLFLFLCEMYLTVILIVFCMSQF